MRSTRATVLAALAAAVIALTVVILKSTGAPSYTLRAVFANVNGLVSTGNVEVAGFKVGEITGISVRMGGYPEVTMRISKSYRVHEGARAAIELGSLAGQLNRYIALSGGTGRTLPDGATIPLAHTSQPVEIDQFLSALDPKTRANLRDVLRDSVHALDGRGPDIQQALRYSGNALDQTAALFGDVSADGSALRTLVTRAAQGAHALATEPGDVQDGIDRLARLLDVAAARQRAITQSLTTAPAAFHATSTALATFSSSIPVFNRLIDATGPALDAIAPFARALRVTAPLSLPVFRATLSLVDSFRTSSPAITKLLGPPLPRTLDDLGAGLVGFNPVVDHLRARAPDVLGWIPLLGDVTADYNANGHGALVFAYPRPPPQRPVSSPSCAAGWLLRPFDRVPGQLACDPWRDYYKTFIGGAEAASSYVPQTAVPGEFSR